MGVGNLSRQCISTHANLSKFSTVCKIYVKFRLDHHNTIYKRPSAKHTCAINSITKHFN